MLYVTATQLTNPSTDSDAVVWLSIQALSAEIDVKESTIRTWIHRRTGPPHYKLGGLVRFRKTDVDDWIATRRTEPDE